jgi:tetratricopeptide (TPR) repeat protein
MERYEAAAEISDEWTRLRPNDGRAWNALCWDKAILGKLQEALRHCDEALRLDSKDANFWDSRGFTYLKLGEFDKAISDYDRALAITDIAFSRYGRGLAKLKKSDTAGGEEDIAAAKAMRSDVEQAFERLGGK